MKRRTDQFHFRKAGLVAAIAFCAAGPASAAVLFGPQDFSGFEPPLNTEVIVDTFTTVQLGGLDQLVVTYSVSRENTIDGGAWLTVGFNIGSGFFDFTSSGVFAALMRTDTNSSLSHGAWSGGVDAPAASWAGNIKTSVDFDALSPNEHAVRITIDGLSSGGFTGVKNVTYEIDHYASSMVTADRSFSGTIDFGGTDVGLTLDLRSFSSKSGGSSFPSDGGSGFLDADHVVNDFTVTAVPEPRSLALIAIAVGMLVGHRRRGA